MPITAVPITMRDAPALLRLCHLVSPALPIGAFGYSQGLEQAVHSGWVHDEASALEWLQGQTRHALGTLDLPLLLRLWRAWSAGDLERVRAWTLELLASRETAELRAEERHLGGALARLLAGLGMLEAAAWLDVPEHAAPALATLFSLAAWRWEIDPEATLCGYLWSWSENQVLAAISSCRWDSPPASGCCSN